MRIDDMEKAVDRYLATNGCEYEPQSLVIYELARIADELNRLNREGINVYPFQ